MKTANRFSIRRTICLAAAGLQLALLPCHGSQPVFTVTPAAVSNSYTGNITLQVTGLTPGATVTIQKYHDIDTNGIIDSNDLLVQQFNLTDGSNFVINGVTNNNVPGDTDATVNGSITARINIRDDFSQAFVGQYLFRLSSPTNAFTPITNSTPFKVTNSYAQEFTGKVTSGGVAVPYAGVILFQPNEGGGDGPNPLGGTVADASGNYIIQAPVGTYTLAAEKSNYVADTTAAADLVLNAGTNLSTNLTLTAATQTISGSIIDTNTSNGLPAISMGMQTSGGLLAIGFTASNGNFNVPVTANTWKFNGGSSAPVAFLGYVGLGMKLQKDTTGGSVSNVTIALSKATAFFYGTVLDNLSNPLTGLVEVYAEDQNNNLYQSDGYADTNGNYVTGVVGGLGGGDLWYVQVDNSSSFPNYVFSQPDFDTNNGSSIGAGQAVLANITATLVSNSISGTLTDNTGAPISGIGINANSGNSSQSADTDTNGNYSINMGSGTWSVGVNSGTGGHSLSSTTYLAPTNQTVVITTSNVTQVDFTAILASNTISGTLTDNNGAPIANVGIYANSGNYSQNVNTGNDGSYSLGVIAGTWNVGVNSCTDCGGSLAADYIDPANLTIVITNSNVVTNFIAILASNTISGTLLDNYGTPMANVGIYANNGNYNQNTDTDDNGNYSLSVVNGTWTVGVNTCTNCGGSDFLPSGYIAPTNQNENVVVDNNSLTVDFVTIVAINTIVGNVQYDGTNVAGVGVMAVLNGDTSAQAYVDTDTNGGYALNVGGGTWSVSVVCQGGNDSLDNILGVGNYVCPNSTNIPFANNVIYSQYSLGVNFNVQPQTFTTTLSGQVVDDGGTPVTNMIVFAAPQRGGTSLSATTDTNGDFQMGINGGNYTLQLNNDPNTGFPARNLVGPSVPITVTDGDNISNFTLVAWRVTGTIQVQVDGTGNAGLSGIGVSATIYINGTNYTTYGQQVPTGNSGATNLPAFNGTWQVNLNCTDVQNMGYFCPSGYDVTISSNTQTATFHLVSSSAQIQVSIDGSSIADGQTSPVNFGSIQQGQQGPSETFTVKNTGFATLHLQGVGVPPGYTLTLSPPSTIVAGSSNTFTVQLTAAGVNTYSGNISITNNAPDSSPFTFAITGTVMGPPPQIGVFNGATVINNNQTNAVNFGFVQQGAPGPAITFTVTNSGGQTLDVATPMVPSGYAVTANPPGEIAAGSQGTFTVQLTNTANASTYSGNIGFINNDPNNNPFLFPVTGTVISGPTATLTVNASPANGGTIIGGGTYPQDSVQTVTATPNSGYEFVAWTGNATGTNNQVMVTMSTNLSVTANFATNSTNITLIIITNGYGTVAVSPAPKAGNLKKGASYTLTATAKNGAVTISNLFLNWTGSITTNKSPLALKAETNLVLQANFIPNPVLPYVGTYNGLFTDTNGMVTEEMAGMLKGLVVGQKGTYTGTLLINGTSHTISGGFNVNDGQATNDWARLASAGGLLTVMMGLNNGSLPQVTGLVMGTNWTANLFAVRATNTVPSAQYTLLIPPDTNNAPPTNSPGGDGYASITNNAGTATITGALADGTTLGSQSVPVSEDGYIPVYDSLYTGKGLLLGWINVEAIDTNGVGLTWIHPKTSSGQYTNGFTNVLSADQLQFSQWINPGTFAPFLLDLSLLTTFNATVLTNYEVTITNSGKVIKPATVTGSIAPKTGLFTLSIADGGVTKVTGNGAMLNGNNGGGYFLMNKTNAGAVLIQRPP